MKILYKTMGLGLLSACLCLLCAAPASAKVCFVGEENCTGGGIFEDYEKPDADGSLCKQEGYTEKSLCQADMTKYIVAYCPYNSNYVMCCGREYSYDACVYPLVADGKCGNRFKCRCDSDKYPYKQQSATICQNTVTGQNYNNSLASGASCVYTGFANGQTSINAYFTECLCDRGIYPKTEEECLNNGSTTTGNSCTDSNGNTYYAACICGDKFKVISSDCKYGTYITDPLCTQGDVVKAPKCCDCNINTYPYEDMNNEEVETYASCESLEGCTRGSRYKATSCKLGYKIDGGKCVPKECDEILTDYIKDKGIKDYVLYETGKTPSATNVIIAKDTGYGAEWKNFYNKKVISAMVYANAIYGSDLVMLESNHEIDLLRRGPYPYPLKQRILSDIGHLSNTACSDAAVKLLDSGTVRFMLGHLSKQNNTPDLAYETTHSAFTIHGAKAGSDYLLGVAGDNGKAISF